MTRQLVERARHGDADAFDALARDVGDECMAIAFRILRDADLASDAVQAALITAWRELPSLRDPDRFIPWLHRILVHRCYKDARHRRRAAGGVVAVAPAFGTSASEFVVVDDRDELQRALRRLTPEQRAVLVFHHYLDLPMPEVAQRLGIPLGTAKSRLHYATTALRACIEADARRPAMSQERTA